MQEKLSNSSKVLLICACLVVVLAGIKAASSIMVPFLLSVFVAVACNPVINWASKYKIPRGISVLLVILLIIVLGMMLAGLVGQSMTEFRQNMPQYKVQLSEQFAWLVAQLARFNIDISLTQLTSYLDPAVAVGMATNILSSLGGVLGNFFLILLTVVFMLFEAQSVPHKVHIALADPDMKLRQIDKVLASVKDYLAIKTVVSLGTGTLVGLWLYVLGVEHIALWSVLAFLLNYIPNIGSIIAAVPAVLVAFIEMGAGVAGLTAVGYVVINTVMGNMVEPRFMGRGLGLSTLVVFLSLVFWGWLLGSVGMLLSVPLTMIVKIALESSENTRWVAQLLSDEDSAAQVLSARQAANASD